MPPKKKGTKKGNDDWEADLGEPIARANSDPAQPDDAAANGEEAEDDAPAGGLMAMMRKNKERRRKKGLSEDFEPASESEPTRDLGVKAPQEATMDDEFTLPDKKGKGAKGGKQAQQQAKKKDDNEEETGEGGRMLTKAEKEKLKKEREKARKKEQVSRAHSLHTAGTRAEFC